MLPKVLLGIVTYEGKDYCWDMFYKAISTFSYPNYDIMIVDNTAGKKYYNELKRRLKKTPHKVYHVLRGKTSREAQAKSLNLIRDKFLEGNYDYWMSVESDLMPPRDIIERLMSHNKDVVGSLYNIGYHYSKTQPPRYCLFATKKSPHGKGLSTENIPPAISRDFFGNGLMRVHGCGFGCTIVSRRILEEFKFWYIHDDVIKHSDVLFYMDLHNRMEDVFVDTNIIIPHHNSDWKSVVDA